MKKKISSRLKTNKKTKKAYRSKKSSGSLIKVATNKDKSVNIKIAENPLDTYRSPHLLDLSRVRLIEKVRPKDRAALNYSDLPAGALLQKFKIFDFFAWEKSEIINFFRKLHLAGKNSWTQFIQEKTFSNKSVIKDNHPELSAVWRETAAINIIIAVLAIVPRLGRKIKQLTINLKTGFVKYVRLPEERIDKTVQFKLRPIPPVVFEESWEEIPQSKKSSTSKSPDERVVNLWLAQLIKKIQQEVKIPGDTAKSRWKTATKMAGVRNFALFFIVALMVFAPIKIISYLHELEAVKGQVLGEAEAAVQNLGYAQNQLQTWNITEAANYFATAKDHFTTSESQLNQVQSLLTLIAEKAPFNNTYKSGKNILTLGVHISEAGRRLLAAVNQLTGGGEINIDKIVAFQKENTIVLQELKAAEDNFKNISLALLPKDNQDKLAVLKKYLPDITSVLQRAQETAIFAQSFLGDRGLKRYLLVFQNDNELRASGGFIGSFALIDIENGKIENLSIPGGGSYDMRAGLNELLKTPTPMQIVSTRWEMQDANWWPDWPTSAKKIIWFYEKSKGPTVDGVIAVNSDWLGELLKVTGPINLPQYHKTISAENFEEELQREIEVERQDQKQPKKILAELAPKIIERLFQVQPKDLMALLSALTTGFKDKDLMIYLKDPQLQQFVVNNNWDGSLKSADVDYLAVVATNIGGGKTDNVIKQDIYHQATITADGSIIDRVLITRHHFGPTTMSFTDQKNRSYLRVYVPDGSKLISAVGFSTINQKDFRPVADYLKTDSDLQGEESAIIDPDSQTKIYQEDNKTVFANWVEVSPGQTQEVVLTYELPFKLKSTTVAKPNFFIAALRPETKPNYYYSLTVQKQSGSGDDAIHSSIIYPQSLKPKVVYPIDYQSGDQALTTSRELNGDLFFFSYFVNK